MGLERYEWKHFETENPYRIIARKEPFGWRVYSFHNKDRVIESHYEGQRHDGGYYSGTRTYAREYWTDLILVRDPKHPYYAELVELERIWKLPAPAPPPQPPTPETEPGPFSVLFWMSIMLYIPVGLLAWLLRLSPLVRGHTSPLWYYGAAAVPCMAFAGVFAWAVYTEGKKPRPEPTVDSSWQDYHRELGVHNARRDAALARARQLTGRWDRAEGDNGGPAATPHSLVQARRSQVDAGGRLPSGWGPRAGSLGGVRLLAGGCRSCPGLGAFPTRCADWRTRGGAVDQWVSAGPSVRALGSSAPIRGRKF